MELWHFLSNISYFGSMEEHILYPRNYLIKFNSKSKHRAKREWTDEPTYHNWGNSYIILQYNVTSHNNLIIYHKYHVKYFIKFTPKVKRLFSRKFSVDLINFKNLNDHYSKTT